MYDTDKFNDLLAQYMSEGHSENQAAELAYQEIEEDPDYLPWLENRINEAIQHQDQAMTRQHEAKADYWINKTIAMGEPPC